jgi:hypothetical protein
MLLPTPINTSPPMNHVVHVKRKTNTSLCAPYFKVGGTNMRYDLFIDGIENRNIAGVCIANTQKSAVLLMANGNHETILFPENYDIMSFLVENDIPVEVKESQTKPSLVDVCVVLIQLVAVRIVSKVLYNGKLEFDIFFKTIQASNHDLVQLISRDDIEKFIRVMTCKMYLLKRYLSMRMISKPVESEN